LQTSVDYFTAPSVPRPPLQSKQAKVTPTQTIPDGLATPGEIKAAVEQRSALVSEPVTICQPHATQDRSVETNRKPNTEANRGQKRPPDSESEPPRLPPTFRSAVSTMATPMANHRPPPAKRPKPGPNIFIPKPANPNKVSKLSRTVLQTTD